MSEEKQTKIIERTDSYDFIKGLYHYLEATVCCDECSTTEHPIQMETINEMDFECPLCHKKVWLMINPVFNFGSHYSAGCKRCVALEKKGIVFGKKKK